MCRGNCASMQRLGGAMGTIFKNWFCFWLFSRANLALSPKYCQVQNFSWFAFIWYKYRFPETSKLGGDDGTVFVHGQDQTLRYSPQNHSKWLGTNKCLSQLKVRTLASIVRSGEDEGSWGNMLDTARLMHTNGATWAPTTDLMSSTLSVLLTRRATPMAATPVFERPFHERSRISSDWFFCTIK